MGLCDPMDCVARQAPTSMGFSRQEHGSGLPFPPSGDLPDPGTEPWSLALQADSLPLPAPLGKPLMSCVSLSNRGKCGQQGPNVIYN